jgi:hypothetical protein
MDWNLAPRYEISQPLSSWPVEMSIMDGHDRAAPTGKLSCGLAAPPLDWNPQDQPAGPLLSPPTEMRCRRLGYAMLDNADGASFAYAGSNRGGMCGAGLVAASPPETSI